MQDQYTAKIISKCADFPETALQLVGTFTAVKITESQFESLHTILQGQMEYIQDEYATLFVQRIFPKDSVTKFYKYFNEGTSALKPRHRDALTTAVNLIGLVAHVPDRHDTRYHGQGGYYSNRFQRRGYIKLWYTHVVRSDAAWRTWWPYCCLRRQTWLSPECFDQKTCCTYRW